MARKKDSVPKLYTRNQKTDGYATLRVDAKSYNRRFFKKYPLLKAFVNTYTKPVSMRKTREYRRMREKGIEGLDFIIKDSFYKKKND